MIKHVAITSSNLVQFEGKLLPQLYTKLQQLGSSYETETGTLLALGAQLAGKPVGALAAILEPAGDIELLSVFVEQQHQRSGVATGLVDSLLRVAAGCYVGERDGEANSIMLKANYLLTGAQLAAFRPFLEHVGITTFVEEDDAYGIGSVALKKCYMFRQAFEKDAQLDAHVMPLSALSTEQRLELIEDADEGDFLDEDKVAWSYCYREGDEVVDLLLVERGYASSIVLRERGELEGSDSRSLLALLCVVLHKAHNELGEFQLFIDGDDVLDKETKEYLKKNGATRYRKQLAWGQVIL